MTNRRHSVMSRPSSRRDWASPCPRAPHQLSRRHAAVTSAAATPASTRPATRSRTRPIARGTRQCSRPPKNRNLAAKTPADAKSSPRFFSNFLLALLASWRFFLLLSPEGGSVADGGRCGERLAPIFLDHHLQPAVRRQARA